MGLGQYGLLAGYSRKNSGAGMGNGMPPVSDGSWTVGADGKVGHLLAQVASGNIP